MHHSKRWSQIIGSIWSKKRWIQPIWAGFFKAMRRVNLYFETGNMQNGFLYYGLSHPSFATSNLNVGNRKTRGSCSLFSSLTSNWVSPFLISCFLLRWTFTFHDTSTMTIWTPTFEQWLFTKKSIHHERIEHRITEQFKISTYSQLTKCCLNIKILNKNTIELLVNWPTVSRTI